VCTARWRVDFIFNQDRQCLLLVGPGSGLGLASVEFTTLSVRSPKSSTHGCRMHHSDWTTPPQISLFFGLTSDMAQNYAFEFRDNEATIYNTNRSRHLRMIEIAMDRNELPALVIFPKPPCGGSDIQIRHRNLPRPRPKPELSIRARSSID
jgi:hypothetical protein